MGTQFAYLRNLKPTFESTAVKMEIHATQNATAAKVRPSPNNFRRLNRAQNVRVRAHRDEEIQNQTQSTRRAILNQGAKILGTGAFLVAQQATFVPPAEAGVFAKFLGRGESPEEELRKARLAEENTARRIREQIKESPEGILIGASLELVQRYVSSVDAKDPELFYNALDPITDSIEKLTGSTELETAAAKTLLASLGDLKKTITDGGENAVTAASEDFSKAQQS